MTLETHSPVFEPAIAGSVSNCLSEKLLATITARIHSVWLKIMKTRDFRLDKAKGLLIFLVVSGHLMERLPGWDMGYSRVLLTGIYSFHMPAFVLLAGITARSNRLVDRTLVFLVLVVTAQPILYYWADLFGKPPSLEFGEPYWITWFLLAMVWWLLLIPLVERFPVFMLVASIAMGLLGGILPEIDYEFTVGRSLTFFPFFVTGKLYGQRLLTWAAEMKMAQKLGLSAMALLPMAVFYLRDFDHRWFYGARGFENLGESIPYGVGMRTLIAASALLTIVVLFAWSESLPSLLIPAGQHTLAIFILHGFIVRAIDEPLNALLDETSGSVAIALSIVLAGLVTWLLSWRRLDQGIRWYSSALATLFRRVLPPYRTRKPTSRH
ncbi:acyltransferase family protein [Brevibacterium antiquum]|uniref:acyltransferase family protein n=1 Tax=Brevibacterium antiquum TaxID=234835 RepID=UPI0018E01229|nr:acyltransferase family protein [Brevibacterium antiquum]